MSLIEVPIEPGPPLFRLPALFPPDFYELVFLILLKKLPITPYIPFLSLSIVVVDACTYNYY
jgi:hypothetical protein